MNVNWPKESGAVLICCLLDLAVFTKSLAALCSARGEHPWGGQRSCWALRSKHTCILSLTLWNFVIHPARFKQLPLPLWHRLNRLGFLTLQNHSCESNFINETDVQLFACRRKELVSWYVKVLQTICVASFSVGMNFSPSINLWTNGLKLKGCNVTSTYLFTSLEVLTAKGTVKLPPVSEFWWTPWTLSACDCWEQEAIGLLRGTWEKLPITNMWHLQRVIISQNIY